MASGHTAHPSRAVLRSATSARPSHRGIITQEPRSLLLLLVLFDFFRRVTLRQEGEKTAAALAEQIAGQKAALCVVGTRRRARELYELLPEEGRYHLSTLMTPRDRERTLDEIRARLRAGETCRVVSTSLIEAGVDVDFPTVWREIAGLDSILQAAGRCNREGKRSTDDHQHL